VYGLAVSKSGKVLSIWAGCISFRIGVSLYLLAVFWSGFGCEGMGRLYLGQE
jgi:hypothetical protein